jgi:tRNA threonylcarbamoyladenosine biosynthesis protein TsaE
VNVERRCFDADSESAQVAFGRRLISACGSQALIFLRGELGAGKTTLTRGVLRGLGYDGAVKSPTYTLIEPYTLAAGRVNHLDLYRVGDPGELEYLGLRELLEEPAITIIEWPERGEGWLPQPDLDISISHTSSGRRLCIAAKTTHGGGILSALADDLQ